MPLKCCFCTQSKYPKRLPNNKKINMQTDHQNQYLWLPFGIQTEDKNHVKSNGKTTVDICDKNV